MTILNKGHNFSSGDNVTATKLDDLVDQATFIGGAGGATDNSTLEVNDGVGGDGSLRVKDVGITTAKLADGAVSTQKIADSAVTSGKIADSAVTSGKIADGAITSGKISTTDTTFNVQTDGDIGIGTDSPSSKVHIAGTGNINLAIESDTAAFLTFKDSGASADSKVVQIVSTDGGLQIRQLNDDHTIKASFNLIDSTGSTGYSAVAVLTGTISNGGTIPLPSGYTQAQCKWMVAVGTISSSHGDHHSYHNVTFTANSSRVVSTSGIGTGSGTANYIIIGVK
jgi:hypothetical protein